MTQLVAVVYTKNRSAEEGNCPETFFVFVRKRVLSNSKSINGLFSWIFSLFCQISDMADVEEAQQVVDISLRKIVEWQNNNNKRVSGSELHRNLLLASVLLKAHRACSENALAHLDDLMTSSDDDDDGSADVTATQDVSSFAATVRTIPDVEPVQDSDVAPDQALEEEWEFFGADNEERPDGGRTDKEVRNIEGTSVNVVKDSLNFVETQTRKRKLEIDESENGFESRRHRTESAELLTCERLCFDLDDLMMSSAEDICSGQLLDMSSTVAASALESFGQSIHISDRSCFDDLAFSADFLSFRR